MGTDQVEGENGMIDLALTIFFAVMYAMGTGLLGFTFVFVLSVDLEEKKHEQE